MQSFSKPFQHRQHLLTPHARKAFKKIINRIAGLQMIEQALHRHASADKNHNSTQNLRVGINHALTFQGRSLAHSTRRFKPGISRLTRFMVLIQGAVAGSTGEAGK